MNQHHALSIGEAVEAALTIHAYDVPLCPGDDRPTFDELGDTVEQLLACRGLFITEALIRDYDEPHTFEVL